MFLATRLLYGKELKRKTLLELVEYVNLDRGQKIFSVDNIMEDVVKMVCLLRRTLYPNMHFKIGWQEHFSSVASKRGRI